MKFEPPAADHEGMHVREKSVGIKRFRGAAPTDEMGGR